MNNCNKNNYNCNTGCPEIVSGRCVKYTDQYLETIVVGSADTFNTAMIKINNYLQGLGESGLQKVIHENTSSIIFSGDGTSSSPLTAIYNGITTIPNLQQVTAMGATTNIPITITGSNPYLIVQGTTASAIATVSTGSGATGTGILSQFNNGTSSAIINISTGQFSGSGRVYIDMTSSINTINTSNGLNISEGGTTYNIFSNGQLTGSPGTDPDHFATVSQLPAIGSYIQNQTASAQTAGFRISGNGFIAGSVGIGTSSPSEKLTIGGGNIAIVSNQPYGNIGGGAYLLLKDLNGVNLGAFGDTSSNTNDIYVTATVSNNIKFINLPVGEPAGNADNFTTAWMDTSLNMGVGVPVNKSISARLHVQSPTEQLRVGFNEFGYMKTTVDSLGNTTFDMVGSLPKLTINKPIVINGSISKPITTTTIPLTLDYTYHTVLVNNTGSLTITLTPAANSLGRTYIIKKISPASNDVIVDAFSAELIDGVTSKTLTVQYSGIEVQSDGTSWWIINNF